MRCNQPNQTKHNTQLHHISDEMQSIKHNTHSHLHLKMHEQLSHFVLDAHFVQDARSKRTLSISLMSKQFVVCKLLCILLLI